MVIQMKESRGQGETPKHSIFIINHDIGESQQQLWSRFQECVKKSQAVPSMENIIAAQHAHQVWANAFLKDGGSYA